MFSGGNLQDQMLKTYIDKIFDKYDTDSSGTLDEDQMVYFFNDLFQSMNMGIKVNKQQALEAIKSIDQNFDGAIDKKQLFDAFKAMMNKPQGNNYPPPPPPQNYGYGNYQQPYGYPPYQQPQQPYYNNPYQSQQHNPYMQNQYNPYQQGPMPNSMTNSYNSPPQNPYGQNPYGQNPYGQNPYNYGNNSNPYMNNSYSNYNGGTDIYGNPRTK